MLNPVFNVSIPKRVSEALKPSTNRNDRCFYCRHVSIPKRVSEALKPLALTDYIIFGFQGTFARTIKIIADLSLINQLQNFE